MDIDDKSAVSASDKAAPLKSSTPADPLPEVEAFAFLLAMIYLLDSKLTAEVTMLIEHTTRIYAVSSCQLGQKAGMCVKA